MVAGRRFGKTTVAITECIQYACNNAYARVWYLAPTYRQAEMIAWKLLLRMIPQDIIKRQHNQKLEIELKNGSLIELKGAENEDSLRGVGLDYCVLDEYAFMRPHIWDMIIQPMFATTKGRALFIGTPDGKNHFYQLWLQGKKDDSYYKSFSFKSLDSPYVDVEFIENERSRLPENVFRQEYEANFEDFTGLVYPEFNQSYHIISPFNVPSFWKRVHAIDPAISTGTTAVTFSAINEQGDIIVYDEYYEENKMVSEHASTIKTMMDSKLDRVIIDPHAGSHTIPKEGKYFSAIDEFRSAGIFPGLGETDVEAGINRVREHLKLKTRVHPYTSNLKDSPTLFVFNTCKNIIHEFERYRYAERPETKLGLMKPRPFKKHDHCVTGDSLVHTVSGDKPIRELVGKTGYLYSFNGDSICSKPFFDVRKTRKDVEVWKVTYTDGQSIKATPDHLIMVRNGEYKPLKDLRVGESLMPFYKRVDNHGHEIIRLNKQNTTQFAHRLVYSNIVGDCEGLQVHHKNENKWDNRPENLEALTRSVHCALHAKRRRNPSERVREKMRISQKRRFYNKEVREAQAEHLRSISHLAAKWHSSPEGIEWHRKHGKERASKGYKDTVDKQCLVCGAWFKAYKSIRHRSLYCTPNCKQKALRVRRKEVEQYHNHKIAKIEFYGYEDVYNLEVADTHNYACNGIIIHNCMDCLRYTCMSRIGPTVVIKKEKIRPKSLERYLREDEEKARDWRRRFA